MNASMTLVKLEAIRAELLACEQAFIDSATARVPFAREKLLVTTRVLALIIICAGPTSLWLALLEGEGT